MSFLEEVSRTLSVHASREEKLLRAEGNIRRHLFRVGDQDPRVLLALRKYPAREMIAPNLFSDEQLAGAPCRMVLVGGAGAGKSFVLRRIFTLAARQIHPDRPVPFLLDVDRDLGTDLDIRAALDRVYGNLPSSAFRQHEKGCYLLLDSLEDRVQKSGLEFVNDLKGFLQSNLDKLKGCVIACRQTAYDPSWFEGTPFAGELFHVDHLGDEEYSQIIKDPVRLKDFHAECDKLGLWELLSRPFEGFFLAREFARGNRLPRNRTECLDERITHALGSSRSGRACAELVPVTVARDWARQLACVATFGSPGPWSEEAVFNLLASSTIAWNKHPATRGQVSNFLQRALFSRFASGFGFAHQLYREFLAAETIQQLSPRKQRQLLGSGCPGLTRIGTPHRGVAAFLAGLSQDFASRLAREDPVVALFAESLDFTQEFREEILRRFVERAIKEERYPWWEVPPRGDIPLTMIGRLCPRDKEAFLRPLLSRKNRTSRMWGAACAAKWDGAKALNRVLLARALDRSEHVDIRCWSLKAIRATGDNTTLEQLRPLTEETNDTLRTDALSLLRESLGCSPTEYLAQLVGGSREETHNGGLHFEVQDFGESLPRESLGEAFGAVQKGLNHFGDLGRTVLRGLFKGALERGFPDVPPELVYQFLSDSRGVSERENCPAAGLLAARPDLAARVWALCLDEVRGSPACRAWQLIGPLVDAMGERLLDQVPPHHDAGEAERRFVTSALTRLLDRFGETSPGLRERIRSSASGYALPPEPSATEIATKLRKPALKSAIDRAFREGGKTPVQQSWRVLQVIKTLIPDEEQAIPEMKADLVLGRLDPARQERIISTFRACVEQIRYEKNEVTQTRLSFAIPFWVLWRSGVRFKPAKVGEFARCYGFEPATKPEIDRWNDLLEWLRNEDEEEWRRTLTALAGHGYSQTHFALNFLSEARDDVLIDEYREKLRTGNLARLPLDDIASYWIRVASADRFEVLRECYQALSEKVPEGKVDQAAGQRLAHLGRHPAIRILFMLMAEGDDWAWVEFGRLLNASLVPSEIGLEAFGRSSKILSDSQTRVLVGW